MSGVVRRSVHTRLTPHSGAPGQARAVLAASCRDWAVPQFLEPGALAVSELVTNAVRHAGTDIGLDLTLTGEGLTVAVHDGGGGEPAIVPVAVPAVGLSTGGRGLAIVASLSADWGVESDQTEQGGKTVWCLLRRPVA